MRFCAQLLRLIPFICIVFFVHFVSFALEFTATFQLRYRKAPWGRGCIEACAFDSRIISLSFKLSQFFILSIRIKDSLSHIKGDGGLKFCVCVFGGL